MSYQGALHAAAARARMLLPLLTRVLIFSIRLRLALLRTLRNVNFGRDSQAVMLTGCANSSERILKCLQTFPNEGEEYKHGEP
jgi:hypothetical protein